MILSFAFFLLKTDTLSVFLTLSLSDFGPRGCVSVRASEFTQRFTYQGLLFLFIPSPIFIILFLLHPRASTLIRFFFYYMSLFQFQKQKLG